MTRCLVSGIDTGLILFQERGQWDVIPLHLENPGRETQIWGGKICAPHPRNKSLGMDCKCSLNAILHK